jgi:hypothetical protein
LLYIIYEQPLRTLRINDENKITMKIIPNDAKGMSMRKNDKRG